MYITYRDEVGIISEKIDENGIDFLDDKAIFNDKSIKLSTLVRIESIKAITAKKAHIIAKRLNLCIDNDRLTFYASNENETEIYSFDTKKERDLFVEMREIPDEL